MHRFLTIAISQLLLFTIALAWRYPEPTGCQAPSFPRGYYSPTASDSSTIFPVGTKLTFRCSLEYELIGYQYATCLSTGKWNTLPQCLDGCRPQEVANGVVTPTPSYDKEYYEYGDVIRVTCNEGYLQLGSGEAKCSKGGWSSYLQCVDGCVAPNIPNLLTLPRPVVGADVYSVNSTIRCRCYKGYYLVGEKDAKCLGRNEWNVELPTCKKNVYCAQPTDLKMGSYGPKKGQYIVGDKITYNCNDGYNVRGAGVSICGENGAFYPARPTCEPIPNYEVVRPGSYDVTRRGCYAPYLPEGVVISPAQPVYDMATEVKFSCKPGYRMIGSARSVCGRKGFRENPPTCEPISCPPPQLPKYAQFVEVPKEKYYYGDEVCYICDQSYTLSGSTCTTCQESGQFDPRPPTCRPESCRSGCEIVPGRSCQCDGGCITYGNCCGDFREHCRQVFY